MFDERFNTDDGLAHLVPAQWLPPRELPDADYPLVLNTGRLLEHWHTGSMTRRSFALDTIAPVAEVYMHPKDAADRGVAHGEMVRVRSRRGAIELVVRVSHREQLGNCFIPFHFREAAANLLDDRRDRPGREDPRIQVLRRSGRVAGRAQSPGGRRLRGRTHDGGVDSLGRGSGPAGAGRGGPGREVSRSVADPGPECHSGPTGLVAPRGAGGTGPRRPPPPLRDRRPGLLLPPLPDRAAGEGVCPRLSRPHLLPPRRRSWHPGSAGRGTATIRTSSWSRCPAWVAATPPRRWR